MAKHHEDIKPDLPSKRIVDDGHPPADEKKPIAASNPQRAAESRPGAIDPDKKFATGTRSNR